MTPSVCVRCPPRRIYNQNWQNNRPRNVPVSMVFDGESLCPTHVMEAVEEKGMTLLEAICGTDHSKEKK